MSQVYNVVHLEDSLETDLTEYDMDGNRIHDADSMPGKLLVIHFYELSNVVYIIFYWIFSLAEPNHRPSRN